MAEGSKLRKFKTGLKERFKDIAGDMQDMRDEGLHSLNELKVEYQVTRERWGHEISSYLKTPRSPISWRHTFRKSTVLSQHSFGCTGCFWTEPV